MSKENKQPDWSKDFIEKCNWIISITRIKNSKPNKLKVKRIKPKQR